MSKSITLLASFGPALLLSLAGTARDAYAATAYNTFDVSEGESAVAAANLQEGLSEFQLMLSSLEASSFDAAAQHKLNPASSLSDAVSGFNAVVSLESGNVALSINSEEYGQLSRRLEFLRISIPATRTELAQLAMTMTSQFQETLANLTIRNLNSIRGQIHDLILMSLRPQDIGVLASRVWRTQLN